MDCHLVALSYVPSRRVAGSQESALDLVVLIVQRHHDSVALSQQRGTIHRPRRFRFDGDSCCQLIAEHYPFPKKVVARAGRRPLSGHEGVVNVKQLVPAKPLWEPNGQFGSSHTPGPDDFKFQSICPA